MLEDGNKSGHSPPGDYFKKRPPQSADPAQAAEISSPGQDSEFLTNYMDKLGRDQKIAKAKNSGIIYYPVSSIKFALLCMFVPFWGYFFWWLYKNFVYQKERSKDKSSPLWRVNMLLFYLRGLLNAMKEEGRLYGIEEHLNVEKIIFYAVMLMLCSVLPPPAAMFGMLAFVPFIFVDEYLIKLNKVANPDLPISRSLSFNEWLLLISGVTYFIFNTFYLPKILADLTGQLTQHIGM